MKKDADWIETHFEMVAGIAVEMIKEPVLSTVISKRYEDQGRGGMWELAEEMTNKFIEQNKDKVWDGEFFDEIESFIESELFPNK